MIKNISIGGSEAPQPHAAFKSVQKPHKYASYLLVLIAVFPQSITRQKLLSLYSRNFSLKARIPVSSLLSFSPTARFNYLQRHDHDYE